MNDKNHEPPIDGEGARKRMRACLCWNCGNLCKCEKAFPHGRPRKKIECADFVDAPPEPKRITHREIADIIGCQVLRVESLVTSMKGVRFLMRALARKGVILTYDIKKNRIYFYREENQDDR